MPSYNQDAAKIVNALDSVYAKKEDLDTLSVVITYTDDSTETRQLYIVPQ